MNAYPLFDAHSRLGSALPVAGLLAGPTPIEPLPDAPNVFLKRDDLTATDYGGNKIRKLDLILAAARAAGRRELLTFGYAGSNFVAAAAWHGKKLGLHTIGYLLPQVNAPYVADNLATALAAGAELREQGSTRAIGFAAVLRSARSLLRHGRPPFWIPPGGSTPLGVIGFVNAAFELRAQVEAGALPEPARIYVAFSSMGTVAGLALGLSWAGLHSAVTAVQVVDRRFASAQGLARLLSGSRALLRRLGADAPEVNEALSRVQIREEFFGRQYAEATPEASRAMRRFTQASGARADSAYSGKALACLYADLDAGKIREPALFWHTFNAHGRPPQVAMPAPGQLPERLRRYFSA